MKKKDRLKRDRKENALNEAILTHWWGVVASVEAIRADVDDRAAILELGSAIQRLISLSIRYGTHRLVKVLPQDQGYLLDTMIVEGLDLAYDALRNGTPLFEGIDFPSTDQVSELLFGHPGGASMDPAHEKPGTAADISCLSGNDYCIRS